MNTKQIAVGVVVGTLVAMIVGYVLFDLLMSDFYAANMGPALNVMREPQLLWAVILGTAAYTGLITYALSLHAGGATVSAGLKAGAVVGALIWASAGFILLGIMNVHTPVLVVVDTVLEGVRGAVTGAAIAAVVRKV